MTLAVIMQMRKRVGLLIGMIAVAIVSFLLMDAIQSQANLFGNQQQNIIGEVDGETLTFEAFDAKDKQVEKQFRYFQGYWQDPNFRFTDEERLQVRTFAWNEFVVDNMLDDEYRALGLAVTDDEINSQLQSTNPRQEVLNFYQQIVDNSGGYNPQNMASVIPQIMAIAPDDQNFIIKDFYQQMQALLSQGMLRDKYLYLFAKSNYAPQWRAALDYQQRNNTSDISIVALDYAGIAEQEIEPTEQELQAYLNDHLAEFQSPEVRDIEYVIFDIYPSVADSAEALGYVNDKWAQIMQNGRDSIFINQYSETPFSAGYFKKEQILTSAADTLFSLETGSHVGPFIEDGRYRIVKLYDKATLPDSVHVRHLFVNPQQAGSMEASMALIDSAKALYDQGVAFDTLVAQFSQNQASGASGGDLGWLTPADNINRPIFNAIFKEYAVGDVFTLESPSGAHLMEILEAAAPVEMVKYNVLDRTIRPGSKTRDSVYTLASRFFTRFGTPDSFTSGAEQYGVAKRFGDNLTGNEITLPAINESAREVLRWAFEAQVGDIRLFKNYEATSDKYVVAHVLNIVEANNPTVESVREELRARVVLDKKANLLMERLAAASAGASSLDQIAQKLNTTVKTATGIAYNTQFIEGVGVEPIIAAAAAGLAVNATSQPLKGQYGVYLISKTAGNEATAQQDYSVIQSQILAALNNRFGGNLFDALRTNANITDQRYKYY